MTGPHPHYASLVLTAADGGRSIFPLVQRVTKIGSGKRNHLVFDHDGVAENHAFIICQMGSYELRRLSDKDVLNVNGSPLQAGRVLNHDDTIEMGPITLRFDNLLASVQEQPANAGRSEEGPHAAWRLFPALIEMVSLLIEENDPKAAAAHMVEIVARLMSCDGVRLLMRIPGKTELGNVAVFPLGASESRFSRTAIEWAEREGATILVADAQNNSGLPIEESLVIKEIMSVLCTPLGDDPQNRIGYLYLDRLNGHKPFTEEDRAFFERLRKLFGTLLSNVLQKESQAEAIRSLNANAGKPQTGSMVFQCKAMQDVVVTSARIARSDIPVLIQAETGTGKELLAKYIHEESTRKGRPFIAINCGAIPETLMESELFGHEKGAFTGADARKRGLMVMADGGTLFLDEISELPTHLQVKLLRVLQEKEIYPVGSPNPVPVDFRVVSATNKDLQAQVQAGKFREDLFFRINVFAVTLPPLRSRERDAVLLAHHFIKIYSMHYGIRAKTLSCAAEKALVSYGWPGNIRELENKIQKAVVLSHGTSISPEDLGIGGPGQKVETVETMKTIREQAERRAVLKALTAASGNISLACKLLDMDRTVLIRLIEKLGIDAASYKSRQ